MNSIIKTTLITIGTVAVGYGISTWAFSPGIAGTWWCRNDANYIHEIDYDAGGSFREYETATAPGIHAEGLPLEYRGTYSYDGQILRTNRVTPTGMEMTDALKVTDLTN